MINVRPDLFSLKHHAISSIATINTKGSLKTCVKKFQEKVMKFRRMVFVPHPKLNNCRKLLLSKALRKMCPYLELFWSVFSRIRTEYGEIWSISPYSFRMRVNTDQNNFEYEHFSCSEGNVYHVEHLAIEDTSSSSQLKDLELVQVFR